MPKKDDCIDCRRKPKKCDCGRRDCVVCCRVIKITCPFACGRQGCVGECRFSAPAPVRTQKQVREKCSCGKQECEECNPLGKICVPLEPCPTPIDTVVANPTILADVATGNRSKLLFDLVQLATKSTSYEKTIEVVVALVSDPKVVRLLDQIFVGTPSATAVEWAIRVLYRYIIDVLCFPCLWPCNWMKCRSCDCESCCGRASKCNACIPKDACSPCDPCGPCGPCGPSPCAPSPCAPCGESPCGPCSCNSCQPRQCGCSSCNGSGSPW